MAPGDHLLPETEAFSHSTRVGSAAETTALGRRLAGSLAGGEIVLLYGDLGAGKTCLVQGICEELAVAEEVVSPTFTLVNTYSGRLTVHHLDFYRIEPGQDLDDIGVPEILDDIWDGQAVGLVEWPGPLLQCLGAERRLELLATAGDRPTARVWHARGLPALPGLPAAWRQVFSAKGNFPC